MNTANDLRNILFDTLNKLKSGEMKIDQALAISEVSKTIIATAQVEVNMAKATNNPLANSTFLQNNNNATQTTHGHKSTTGSTTHHRLAG